MEYGEGKIEPGVLIELTEEQKRARKFRSIAIGLALAVMVGFFYYGSVARFTAKISDRADAAAAATAAADTVVKENN